MSTSHVRVSSTKTLAGRWRNGTLGTLVGQKTVPPVDNVAADPKYKQNLP